MLNVVKVFSSSLGVAGKRIVKFLRLGGDDVQTSYQSSPFGFDAAPTKDMVAIYGKTGEKGKTVVIGYINPNQIVEAGESRVYSTDVDGNFQISIYLRNDGTIELGGADDNLVRFSDLKAAFDALRDDVNSQITTVFNTHVHPDPVSGVSGIPTVLGTPSTADVSGAKIDELKTS